MALVLADRVLETTTTVGSGTISLAGAKAGFQSFAVIGNGNTTYYTIAGQSGGEWEVGIGTYTASGTTLSRDTVLASSNNGTKVTFSAGTKDVFVDYPAETALYPNQSGNISALSGKIINLAAPEDNSDAATKKYVDDLVSTGLYYHDPVQLTTTSSFTGYSITYNNGTAGVSATITQASSYSSLTIDSTGAAVGNRILVKNAANAAYNGVYVVNSTGSGATPWVMTRSTDTDSYGPGTGDLSLNDYFFTQGGITNKGSSFVCTVPSAIIFGTTAITFSEFSNSQVYSAGTGIDITGVTISLQTPVTVANGGTGAVSLTGYVKGNGASALSTVSTIPASDISGTLNISQGGTGSGTQQGAINALAGAVTSGYFLRGNGTNAVMSAIQTTDVPTLNQNTTGQAGSVANALTMDNSGAGSASGTTYNGSAARTISYNSVGAAPSDGSTTITKLGTITTGTWNAGNVTASGGTITATNIGTLATTQFQGASASITTISGTTSQYTNVGIQASTQFQGASANITTITGTTITGTTVSGTNMGTQATTQLQAASANITTVTGTTISATNMGALATTQLQAASASITTITGTTSKFTNSGDQNTTQFQGASANITTSTGTTIGSVTGTTGLRAASAQITTLTGVTTLSGTNFTAQSLTLTNALATSSGGTGATSLAAANIAVTNASNTFTAAQTFRAASAVRSEAASTQDAIVLAGRAGGTSSYAVTFTPATLSANRTVTLPDTTGTLVLNNTDSGSNITLDTLFGGF